MRDALIGLSIIISEVLCIRINKRVVSSAIQRQRENVMNIGYRIIVPTIFVLICLVACGGGSGGGVTPPSKDAALASLIVSAGTLSPSFDPASFAYTDLVPMASSSVDVTATTASANAKMTVDSATVSSGTLKTLLVPVGQSTKTIAVLAQDGTTTNSYTIAFTRPGITLTPAVSNSTPSNSVTMTITLAAPVNVDTVVNLLSSDPSVHVPAFVVVTAGSSQVTFSATSFQQGTATITANFGADSPTATINVSPY